MVTAERIHNKAIAAIGVTSPVKGVLPLLPVAALDVIPLAVSCVVLPACPPVGLVGVAGIVGWEGSVGVVGSVGAVSAEKTAVNSLSAVAQKVYFAAVLTKTPFSVHPEKVAALSGTAFTVMLSPL